MVEAFSGHWKLREGSLTDLIVNTQTHDLVAVKGGIRLYTAAQNSQETP